MIGNVLKSLLTKGLIEEVPRRADDTIWRYGDEGEALSLRATPAAFAALGIEPDEATQGADEAPSAEAATIDATTADDAPLVPTAPPVGRTREGSKQARLVEMLKRPEGVTIAEAAEALEWQHHTVRGAIASARKKKLGLTIESEKVEEGEPTK